MYKGIVINHIANLYQVKTVQNKIYTCQARGKFKKDKIEIVVGDNVSIESIDETKQIGVIESLEERTNYCKRPKIANLTQIMLVVSMEEPKPDWLLLDKQLAFAQWMHITPIICFNKIDLTNQQEIQKMQQIYEQIGYQVIQTNAKTGENIETIKELLKKQITAFSGNSGVGKSTLINCIFPNKTVQEGEISQKNQKGKNTTTAITLYEIEQNSYIADTPGFSTFEITEIPSQDLQHYFIEFEKEMEKCEFLSCNHIKEEKCGIKQAVKQGKIAEQRYQNYCQIYQELKEKENHKW